MPRFRYSLRTLFIVMTLVAIPCAWVGWQAKIVGERKAMLDEIVGAGGTYTDIRFIAVEELPWYRHMLGDEEVSWIDIPNSMRDRFHAIQEMFPEAAFGDDGAILPPLAGFLPTGS